MAEIQLFFNDCTDGNEFESFIVRLLRGLGFKAQRTKKGGMGDGGVDIIAEITVNDELLRFAIQCKYQNSVISKKAVQEIFTGIHANAEYSTMFPVVITNNSATMAVRYYADKVGVELITAASWGELRNVVKGNCIMNPNVRGLMAVLTSRIINKTFEIKKYTTQSERLKSIDNEVEKEREVIFRDIDLIDETAYELEHRALFLHEKASKQRSKAILESLRHG